MEKSNMLYTTVTVSDFIDGDYINELISLTIGLELALLTNLSGNTSVDFENLKKEMQEFCYFFEVFGIQKQNIRIHQPGGYMYNWSNKNNICGFEPLCNFFEYCHNLGFEHFVIHAPYGDLALDQAQELCEYREKLSVLVPHSNLEVEEIVTSNKELKMINETTHIRCYSGELFEQLLYTQHATPLLDVYECGGVEQTIKRLQDLLSKHFTVNTVHLHKDKHKYITQIEFEQLIQSQYAKNITAFVNEGFVKANSSFDEFVKTKSADCVVPHSQRIEILKRYKA